MQTLNSTPLGFSDLTSDEAFIVSVFRHWQACGATHQDAENGLTNLLRNDPLHDGLRLLFDLFGTLSDQDKCKQGNDSSVLTPIEEALLNEIGLISSLSKRCVKAFQRVLEDAGTTIRPASLIPRSGHDYLVELIDRKTAKVFDVLYPEFSKVCGSQT
jgi:hypothetical protein